MSEKTKRMPSSAEIKRANEILHRAHFMNLAKQPYSRRWIDYEKIWKMVEEKRTGEDAWRASLPDTWAFATIKTAQSAFVDSKIEPIIIRHKDDPKSKADDLRDLYIDIAEKGNIDDELYFLRLDAFKLGNAYGKTIYVKDKRKVWNIEKFDPIKNEYEWKLKTINEFDDPKTIRVSPYLMLIDDLARADWDTVRDCIEIEVMGRDEAQARYGNLVDFNLIPQATKLFEQLKAHAGANVAETDGRGLRGTDFEALQKYHFFAPGFDWNSDVVEILHYYNRRIKTPSGAQDSYEILVNGYPVQVDTKNTKSPNPYIHKQLPYFHIPYSPYSGDEHFAMGIIEAGQSEIKAIRKAREMMTDRQKISLFSPVFSDVNDEIDQKQLTLKPLSIIRTRGGVPKQFQIPGLTNADLALQDRDEASFKRAVGVDERILGMESTGPRLTATEISFIREAALKRLREFAFLYKNRLLHGEIKLKLSLFRQYFANPLSKERATKDKGIKNLKAEFKKFKIKIGNTYVSKELPENFFEGEVDVDLDLQLLLPMTPAQMATVWSQIIRDTIPAIQAGVVDYSLTKLYDNYIEALLQRNPQSLKENAEEISVEMAEAEHNLYADINTSKNMKEVLPEGTPDKYLTGDHIKKHEELLDASEIDDSERMRLIEHIKQDIDNYEKKLRQQQQSQRNLQALTPEAIGGLGGIGGGVPQPTPQLAPTV